MIELSIGDITDLSGQFRISALGMGVVETEIVPNFLLGVSDPPDVSGLAPYLIAVKRDVMPAPWGMYWGSDGFVIDSAAVLAQYWPETMELGCFRSAEEAWMTLQWLKDKQDVWRDQVLSHNGNEPSRQRPGRTAQ